MHQEPDKESHTVDIPGKSAVATGAGSGVGQPVSLELVRRGVSGIALVDRTDSVNHLAAATLTLEAMFH